MALLLTRHTAKKLLGCIQRNPTLAEFTFLGKNMNYLLIIIGCVISLSSFANTIHRPPVRLTATEAQKARVESEKGDAALQNHYRVRLARILAREKQAEIAGAALPPAAQQAK